MIASMNICVLAPTVLTTRPGFLVSVLLFDRPLFGSTGGRADPASRPRAPSRASPFASTPRRLALAAVHRGLVFLRYDGMTCDEHLEDLSRSIEAPAIVIITPAVSDGVFQIGDHSLQVDDQAAADARERIRLPKIRVGQIQRADHHLE